MRACSPSEFLVRWPGTLHLLALPQPRLAIPEDSRRLLTEFGLPRCLTINCYNDITIRFSDSASPLAEIWMRDINRGLKLGEMPQEWKWYWHVGDEEYAQGGGWICIEELTGRLVLIDLDQNDPIYLINSSIQNFYFTLAHFLEWSQTTDGSAVEIMRLRDQLRQQRLVEFKELEPFWINILDATLDESPARLVISLSERAAQ